MNDKSLRFAKLMSTMGAPKQAANPGIDDQMAKRLERERQVQLINDKIMQLEESDDPNALDSLNFWKSQLAKISAD